MSDLLAVLRGFVGEGIATIGGAKNCATTGQNAADGFLHEFLCGLGPDKSIKAVADAETRMPRSSQKVSTSSTDCMNWPT